MNVIESDALSFTFDAEPILNKISFSIKQGEFIGIIGPNGGGKTTFLKLLMGLLKPTSGHLTVLGTSPKLAREKLAYVPQIMRFDRHFPITVFELVLEGRLSSAPWWGGFREKDKKAALDAIKKVGLSEFKDRTFGTLSGGQAQRALIARALVSEPQILLLDEPTASVDNQAEQEIHAILDSIKDSMTILMVTHDLNAVLHQVRRVFCIQRELTILSPDQLCQHFAMGLYHPPLKTTFKDDL